VASGGIRCSKGTLIIKKPNPSLLSKEEQRKKKKKQKSWHWTNIWPWVPAGLNANSDRAGWLPAVSYCSALLCSALLCYKSVIPQGTEFPFRRLLRLADLREWGASVTRWLLKQIPCSRIFFFYPQDGGDIFLQNVGLYNIYTAPHPRRPHSSFILN
jgi:hypothetical protein